MSWNEGPLLFFREEGQTRKRGEKKRTTPSHGGRVKTHVGEASGARDSYERRETFEEKTQKDCGGRGKERRPQKRKRE